MNQNINDVSKEIIDYLEQFKNEEGEPVDILKVGYLIKDYCNLYIEEREGELVK